jgi:hypothetical protein
LCATITVVEPVAGVVVAGRAEVAVLAVCVAALAGVVVGGATVPGWAALVGAEVLVVAEAGVVLVGTVVLAGTDVVGVVVVAMWTLADAGILTPRSLLGVVPAAWAPAGTSAVSAHAAATINAVRAWRKLRLGLAVIAFAMLTAGPLLREGDLAGEGTNVASPHIDKL